VSALVDSKLIIDVDRPWWTLRALSLVELGLLATYRRDARPRWANVRFALFGLCLALSAIEVVRLSPVPAIDVWTVQTEGAQALLHGQDPFEVVRVRDTAPGVLDNPTPYVYPPFQLVATLPFFLLGDVRYAMITALAVFGFVVRRPGPGRDPLLADAPALVVWLSPKVLFILQQAWIDPVQIALIALACALALRRRAWLSAVVFGFVLAAKQTMFLVAPLAFFAFPIFRLRHAAVALALGVAFHVPFALWDWPALYHANFGFVGGLPPRPDALGFVNWARRALGVHVPYGIAFPLAGAVVGWFVLRRRGRSELFGATLLVTYFVFFTLNKWTFANYYFSLLSFAALGASQLLRRASA
jgi:hypothetical protein